MVKIFKPVVKPVIVESCGQCPFAFSEPYGFLKRKRRLICTAHRDCDFIRFMEVEENGIPEWCQLEDAE
jgi:hypothetical protein